MTGGAAKPKTSLRPIFVGAYPLLMSSEGNAPTLYKKLSTSPHINALEVPWSGSLTVANLLTLRSQVPKHWQMIITMIPGTMAQLTHNPSYGLASENPDSARAAVSDVIKVHSAVHEFHELVGTTVVTHIELHSAPRAAAGTSRDAFTRSLGAIRDHSMSGPEFVVEHVDAATDKHRPAKGFLSLADEIAAVSDAGMGITVNWGRSAIEARHSSGAEEHIVAARDAGVLRGLVFSGASDVDTDYGPAWSDEHLPFADAAAGSLLTAQHAERAVVLAGDAMLGIKMNWRGQPATVDAAAQMVAAAAELVAMLGMTALRPERLIDGR